MKEFDRDYDLYRDLDRQLIWLTGFDTRISKVLYTHDIYTLRQLLDKGLYEVSKIRGLGEKSIVYIEDIIKRVSDV